MSEQQIRAALRHRLQAETRGPVFRAGDLVVDLARRVVTVAGSEQLTFRPAWGPVFLPSARLRSYRGRARAKSGSDGLLHMVRHFGDHNTAFGEEREA